MGCLVLRVGVVNGIMGYFSFSLPEIFSCSVKQAQSYVPFLPRELANKGVVFLSEQQLGLLSRYLIT